MKKNTRDRLRFWRQPQKRLTMTLSSLFAAIVIGLVLFSITPHADTPTTASFQAEAGMRAGNVTTIVDTGAAGGNAIKFGAGTNAGYVAVCGKGLCINDSPWYMYGASVYQGLNNPNAIITQAQTAKLNTVRITDFIVTAAGLSGASDEAHWRKVDALLAAASQANLKVLLDLSTYRNMLKKSSINPYTYNWQSFLNFVMTRTNTINGRSYKDDPTIAIVALAGEVDPPNSSNNPLGVTQQQVTDFFSRTLAQLAATGSRALRTSGGLLQLSWNSGIDWRAIMADQNNQICNIHNYSQADQNYTPTVATYCDGIGKPWITEEFGFNQTDGDSSRANEFQAMYNLQKNNHSAGVAFWNLGTEVVGVNGKTETFDVNTSTPLTLQVVQQNAP